MILTPKPHFHVMAQTLTQIMKQIDDLKRQAEKVKQQEVTEVIGRIKEAIALYGLSASDLGLRKQRAAPVAAKRRGRKAKAGGAKFRDPSGRTWSGRGRRPQWFVDALAEGKKPEDLMV